MCMIKVRMIDCGSLLRVCLPECTHEALYGAGSEAPDPLCSLQNLPPP